ncbi:MULTISPECIES: hypothetical protein [Brevundimonas]|uniref:hypothetical protein n=1 Tax=Brevundimonas TaxID=41275 RepID=UPI000ECFD6E6|nr:MULTISPECIES: hypothetical protein [Brevundimonas]HAC00096.1 hypothetical protein [Brevundimonas sp.]
MSNPSAAEQIQQIIQQQSSLLTQKALLTEQLEMTSKNLNEVRAVLHGIELGRQFAQQEAERANEAASTQGD